MSKTKWNDFFDACDFLGVYDVDENWVREQAECGFAQFPVGYTPDEAVILEAVPRVVQTCIHPNISRDKGIWEKLKKAEFKPVNFIALLNYSMRNSNFSNNLTIRIQAATAYVGFLNFLGSEEQMHLFHTELFKKVFDILNQVAKKSNPKSRKKNAFSMELDQDQNLDVTAPLEVLCKQLIAFLPKCEFNSSEEFRERIAQISVYATRDERIQEVSFNYLRELANGDKDSTSKTTIMISRILAKHIMDFPSCSQKVFQFSTELYTELVTGEQGAEFSETLFKIIKRVCENAPEKLDGREKVCAASSKWIKLLPSNLQDELFSWIGLYSKTNKTAYRLFAIFLCFTLLSDENLDESKALVLASTLLMRINDKIAGVRSKALSFVAQIMMIRPSFKDKILFTEENVRFVQDIRKRCKDEKSAVRRAALQILESLSTCQEFCVEDGDLEIIYHRSKDRAVFVRKQALSTLRTLMDNLYASHPLQGIFLDCVLHLAIDEDKVIQSKAIEALKKWFVDPLTDYKSPKIEYTWQLLNRLSNSGGNDLTSLFKYICKLWVDDNVFEATHAKSLMKYAAQNHELGVWLLISEMSRCGKLFSLQDLASSFEKRHSFEPLVSSYILKSVCNLIDGDSLEAREIADCAFQDLRSFKYETCVIMSCISILQKTTGMTNWGEDIINDCDGYLARIVFDESGTCHSLSEEPSQVIRYIYTLGEVSMKFPELITERHDLLIQSFANNAIKEEKEESLKPNIPINVRAAAFTALGKFCLHRESLAKNSIASFAYELQTSEEPVIRNNIVVIMCDLCVRYSTLVESFLPNIYQCLTDSNEIVRLQTLNQLCRLLQHDYIKWKGSMFFQMLGTFVDEDESIRRFAKKSLFALLSVKYSKLVYNYFVECILFFNHAAVESDKFTSNLEGKANFKKRTEVYSIMLRYLNSEQKIQIVDRLCNDILTPIRHKEMEIDSTVEALLGDCFWILSCPEMKLTAPKSTNEDDAIDDAEQNNAEMQRNAIVAAKNNLISKIAKKNILENIVPLLKGVKEILEEHHSWVVGPLMGYFKIVMQDHREELKDVLAGDPQLFKEIEFDLQNEKTRMVAAAALTTTSGAASPSTPATAKSRNRGGKVSLSSSPVTKTPRSSSSSKTKSRIFSPGLNLSAISHTLSSGATSTNGKKSQSRLNVNTLPSSTPSIIRSSPRSKGMAIDSTPRMQNTSNISFSIPPSPIYTSTQKENLRTLAPKSDNIIHLQSPDVPTQKPRLWNVSPKPVSPRTSRQKRDHRDSPYGDSPYQTLRRTRMNPST